MIPVVRTLGAPVTDAGGKRAPKMPAMLAAVWQLTVLVICQTVGYCSTEKSPSTVTLPASAMRPRSLRTMSVTMTFSARSLGEARSSRASRRSSARHNPRLAVPFMGRDTRRSPSRLKKSSGDALQTDQPGMRSMAANPSPCAAAIAAKSACGREAIAARRRKE